MNESRLPPSCCSPVLLCLRHWNCRIVTLPQHPVDGSLIDHSKRRICDSTLLRLVRKGDSRYVDCGRVTVEAK